MGDLRIRSVRTDDAAAVAAIYAPFVTDSVVSFEMEAPSASDMKKRITENSAHYPWLVAEDDSGVVGYAYASQHSGRVAYQWSANVTIYLADGHRRGGLGGRLYGVLFALLQRQNFRSLYAGITLPNDASVALHRKMGMSEVGVYRNVGFKFGAWRDVVYMGLSFDDDCPPAGPPAPFSAVSDADIAALLR